MGATPINLNSPEQLSQVIFSRRIHNKKEWSDLFEYADNAADYKSIIEANSDLMRKTVALHCDTCNGTGKTFKTKKDGTPFKKGNACPDCGGKGYRLKETREMAGLGFNPPPARKWISYNGFATGKDKLDALIATANNHNMESAKDFLKMLKGFLLLVVICLALSMVFPPTLNKTDYSTLPLPSISPIQVDFLDGTPTCRTCQEGEPSLLNECLCPGLQAGP